MPFLRVFLLLIILFSRLAAQETPPADPVPDVEVEVPAPPLSAIERKREALSTILVRKDELEKEILEVRKKIASGDLPVTEFEQSEASKKIAELQVKIDNLDSEFSKVSTGLDSGALSEVEGGSFEIEQEIREILKPIIQEFRDITADPRKAEELRTMINELERRKQVIREADETLEKAKNDSNPEALKEALANEEESLQSARLEIETQLGIAKSKLTDIQENSPSILQSVSSFVQDFFRSRGAHLLMAIGAAIATVVIIRILYRSLMRLRPKKHRSGDSFTGRLVHLCYGLVSVVGGIFAFIFTLYLANDWLLLAVALLFLFGVAWTGKNTIPQFFDQGKMILNLGTVRYHERITYEGIPWEVQKVNFYTSLINPALEGGKIRLPIRDLMSLHSRPNGEDELWFPCRQDDWVLLSDETFGKVLQQTPDYVHLVMLGGTRKVIPTAEFLSLHPANLSKNFRLQVTFGIDYSHQSIAISQVPKIFEVNIQRALLEKMEKEDLLSVKVFFTAAAASSLDYRIVVDLVGELAPRRRALQDLISATCVEVCNKQGWIIPFTQITVHHAPEAPDSTIAAATPHLP